MILTILRRLKNRIFFQRWLERRLHDAHRGLLPADYASAPANQVFPDSPAMIDLINEIPAFFRKNGGINNVRFSFQEPATGVVFEALFSRMDRPTTAVLNATMRQALQQITQDEGADDNSRRAALAALKACGYKA